MRRCRHQGFAPLTTSCETAWPAKAVQASYMLSSTTKSVGAERRAASFHCTSIVGERGGEGVAASGGGEGGGGGGGEGGGGGGDGGGKGGGGDGGGGNGGGDM